MSKKGKRVGVEWREADIEQMSRSMCKCAEYIYGKRRNWNKENEEHGDDTVRAMTRTRL